MSTSRTSTLKTLSIFSLIMITVGSVDSIRNLPATAMFGSELIFYFLIGAICFLLPCALITAELASNHPEHNGVYDWVKLAFGEHYGFFAIWLQWVENVIWYPTILAFVAGTLGYLISPDLAASKWFLTSVILIAFWGATFLNLLGIQLSALFSAICSIGGLFLPMAIIILLGIIWIATGHHMQIHFSWHALLPIHHDTNLWVSLTGIMLSFCGMEVAAVHAQDVKNPQRDFPIAMIASVAIIVVTLLLGSLAIAIVLPSAKISLVAGLMQAFDAFFTTYHLHWMMPLVAMMLIIGGMGGVNNWIIAPVRGLLLAAKDGYLPRICQRENRHRAPAFLLITQAVLVSGLATAFIFMPSVNGSYWLLTALASQLYMIMYVMMFIAGVVLRKSTRDPKAYRIPGGRWGIWLMAFLGTVAAVTTFIVGFIPPMGVDVGGQAHYEILLSFGLAIMLLPPLLIAFFGKAFFTSSES
ncbi:MAG: transporter [marine bacterium B5-7]|nr:MAG: transporter [marine bacterium B5-7]